MSTFRSNALSVVLGRILNSLYLVAKKKLEQPVPYLSRYIINTKSEYYLLLQITRGTGDRDPWLLYLLRGVEKTSMTTIELIEKVRDMMNGYEEGIRRDLSKIYSYELLNNLFRHPYTTIEVIQKDLGVSELTARKYLSELSKKPIVVKYRLGKYNYYINQPLMQVFEIDG